MPELRTYLFLTQVMNYLIHLFAFAVLNWLNDRFRVKGISGIKGFHSTEELINHLIGLGHDRQRIDSEILSLLRNSLIVNESQKINEIDKNELISINTSGIIHLDLIEKS